MKKLMVMMAAGASSLALCAASSSDNIWFSDAVAAYPDSPTEGGEWSNTNGNEKAEGVITFDADAASPLTYTAPEAKDLAAGTAALSYSARMTFTPFASIDDVEVPSNAKAAVVLVGSEAPYSIYVLGSDMNPETPANTWVELAGGKITAESCENVLVSVTATIENNQLYVEYAVGDAIGYRCAVEATGTSFAAASVSGSGVLAALSGTYTPAAPTLYTVSLSTNEVAAATIADVANNTQLAASDIPEFFSDLKGSWDVDPVGAVITCNTNFNFTVAAEPQDWPADPSTVEGQKAGDVFKNLPAALEDVDACKLATWAKAKGVAFAAQDEIKANAFLLDCANSDKSIAEEQANFKVSISVVDGVVTITPANGGTYKNGKIELEGRALLTEGDWAAYDSATHKFVRAKLVPAQVDAK